MNRVRCIGRTNGMRLVRDDDDDDDESDEFGGEGCSCIVPEGHTRPILRFCTNDFMDVGGGGGVVGSRQAHQFIECFVIVLQRRR